MQVKHLGLVDCAETLAAMQQFTQSRSANTPDELWLCEHHSVYTLGLSEQSHLMPAQSTIACIKTNRGGQITYHGPGQLVAYPLVDLTRLHLPVRDYVHRLEEAIIKTLNHWHISAHRIRHAPGVYVNEADPHAHPVLPLESASSQVTPARAQFHGMSKIAALGIKVTRHHAYHGLALNVNMDLTPFEAIHACGYPELKTTDLRHLGLVLNCDDVGPF